jgi:hypothetical protein
MENQEATRLAARWRFSAPILCIVVAMCAGISVRLLYTLDPHRDHAGITIEQAAELLKASSDNELRMGALFALDIRVRKAIAALRLEVEHGNPDAATLLAQWRSLLRE